MKLLFKSVILFGFILMLGSAGSADAGNVAFSTVVINTVLGFSMMLIGIYANGCYSRALARRARRARMLQHKRRIEKSKAFAE